MSVDEWYAPVVPHRRLSERAAAAVMVASLNVVLGGALAWRHASPADGYHAVAARGPEGTVPVWGARRCLQPERAVLVNAALGHHFSFDDTADVLLGHPSVVLVPALLAVTQEVPLTRDDYLSGYASGYECMVRLAGQLNPGHYRRGFHTTATLGTLGAANAVAVARGADPAQRVAAVGIAASRAGGLRAGIGYPSRAWHAGFAATAGTDAALLAIDGVRPNPFSITGPLGFLAAFGDRPVRPTSGPAPAPHGEDGGPALNGPAVLNLKEYPGCGALAPALSALAEALGRLGAGADQVAGVAVTVNPFVLEVVGVGWPRRAAEAGFSLRFALAVTMQHGHLRPGHLTEQAIGDARLRNLGALCTITTGEVGPSKYESSVRVRTRDGRVAGARRPGVGGRPAGDHPVAEVVRRWSPRPTAELDRAAEGFTHRGPDGMRSRTSGLLDAWSGQP